MPELDSVVTRPKVSVIILNYNGLGFLPRCIETLRRTTYSPFEIVVVDNHSRDDSLNYLRQHHPDIKIIALDRNLGYSGAYNEALPQVGSEYVVLLNFDTEVEPNWLDQPMDVMLNDSHVAAVQPKLKSLQNRQMFEYSGGSGGFLDCYGYPFVRGRIFEAIEKDTGQYEDVQPIFWATGAAFVTRKSAYNSVGGLDSDFFLHMEELDLCWRYWNSGWQVQVAPKGTVYHYAGAALAADKFHKMYYNHRNGLIMMVKNYETKSLWRYIPIRILLDWITVFASLIQRMPKRAGAVIAAHGYITRHWFALLRKRRAVQRMRTVADRDLGRVILPGSIVWRHYIRRQHTFKELTAGW